jgi:hypothetical protein
MKNKLKNIFLTAAFICIMPFCAMTQTAGSSFANPINLLLNETVTGSFKTTGQIVYYSFTAPVTGRYQIKSDLVCPQGLHFTTATKLRSIIMTMNILLN